MWDATFGLISDVMKNTHAQKAPKNENIFFGASEDRTIDDQINQIKLQPDMLISGSVIQLT